MSMLNDILYSAEEGIYLAVTDAPTPVRFNITDLSTLGRGEPLLVKPFRSLYQ
jgi:hypothetical protein